MTEPSVEITINNNETTMDGKTLQQIVATSHIPHLLRIVVTTPTGYIAIKGQHVKLKHLGGEHYHLTFE